MNTFSVKWSLDLEVRKVRFRKYCFLIVMAFVLLCCHLAIGVVLSWQVLHIFLLELHYLDMLSARYPVPFFVTSDSYNYFRWLLAVRCRAKCNRKRVHIRLFAIAVICLNWRLLSPRISGTWNIVCMDWSSSCTSPLEVIWSPP